MENYFKGQENGRPEAIGGQKIKNAIYFFAMYLEK
jgi:hypothetical protein